MLLDGLQSLSGPEPAPGIDYGWPAEIRASDVLCIREVQQVFKRMGEYLDNQQKRNPILIAGSKITE
jgi:hypothetical protein